jgi:hypothetical protein
MALFQDMSEGDIADIAQGLNDFKVEKGELLYSLGDRADNFYFLLSGTLKSWKYSDSEKEEAFAIEAGDSFGERALMEDSLRQYSVSAHTDAGLLYMPRAEFERMLEAFPEIAERLEIQSSGDSLKREVDFDWLREDEDVHFVARKHNAYLWLRMARAILLAIFAFLSFYAALTVAGPSSQFPWVATGAGLLLLATVVAFWEYFDWRNDYYILTNLRVVWLENLLLRSSSRKEAPLASIQSINTHTSLLGRMLDFGDVIIRTYTGTVLMPAVGEPMHIKHMIAEYVMRQRQQGRQEKHETIRQAVRQSLGHPLEENLSAKLGEDAPQEMIDKGNRFQFFTTRQVNGVEVTYHKHWFVLFRALLFPALFMVAAINFLLFFYEGLPPTSNGLLLSFAFVTLPIAVMIYRIMDWQNDIYRVTADSLIDSEKKPLGSEVTKSAPLANVLSLENHRVGLIGLLLNFGVVRINVGDSSLEFADVYDPALIQQDIFIRMEALKMSAEESKADDERKRMAEWLKVLEEERGGEKSD